MVKEEIDVTQQTEIGSVQSTIQIVVVVTHRRSLVASSLPQWPQPSGLPARLLRCSLPQGILFYKLTSLSFFLSDSLSVSLSLSLYQNEMKIMK